MSKKGQAILSVLLVYGLALLCLTAFCAMSSCSLLMPCPLDEKSKMPPLPPTGIPWLDAALWVGGLLLTAAGTHKYTMKKRDKTRAEVLKGKTA